MITSFKEYRTLRENKEFEQKFHNLCEAIVRSGVRFEDYWSRVAVPVINESHSYSNEEELLNEAGSLFSRIFGGGKKPEAKPEAPMDWSNLPPKNPAPAPAPMPGASSMSTDDPNLMGDYEAMQKAAKEKQRAEKLAQFQSTVDSQIETVKQRFATAMKDFLKAMTGDAKQQNDPHMWKIAQSFYRKIMSAAQPVVDEFKMQARYGKASYRDNFARVAGPHQQKVQDFYGNLGKAAQGAPSSSVAGGSQPASPVSKLVLPGQAASQGGGQKIWTPDS